MSDRSIYSNIPTSDPSTWLGPKLGEFHGLPVRHSSYLPEGILVVVDNGVVVDTAILPKHIEQDYEVHVYPVGLLRDIKHLKFGRRKSRLKLMWATVRYALKNSDWHRLKTYLNGYLCELTPWPEGVRRFGSGWTQKRALRSMMKQLED